MADRPYKLTYERTVRADGDSLHSGREVPERCEMTIVSNADERATDAAKKFLANHHTASGPKGEWRPFVGISLHDASDKSRLRLVADAGRLNAGREARVA